MFSIYIFLFVVVNATQQNIIYIMAVLKKIYILNIFVPQQSYWANRRKDKAKNAT
jgi:hypothetical protein